MKLQLFNIISGLFCALTLIGCASGSIPDTPTSQPATQIPAISTLAPTSTVAPLPTIAFLPTVSLATVDIGALPTFSFSTPATAISTVNTPPIATSTLSGESPFEFVATLDEIMGGISPGDALRFQSTSNGDLWLIAGGSIARLTDSGWKAYLSNYGYGSYFVGMDTLGRAWVIYESFPARPSATNPGAIHASLNIAARDGTNWTNYSSESGSTDFSIDPPRGFSMAESHGLIWVSTVGDVRVFDGSRWKVVNTQAIGLTPPSFLVVKSFAGGKEVWVTDCYYDTPPALGSDIYWYDESGWHSKSMPEPSHGCFSTMHEDRQGNIWLGVDNALWRFTRATREWTQYPLPEPSSAHLISTSMAFNEAGEPWFTSLTRDSQGHYTRSTLYHLKHGAWIPSILPNTDIWGYENVLIDNADRVWVSWDGVYQIVNYQPKLVSHLQVRAWTMDKDGKIWAIGIDPSVDNRLSLWVVNP